MALDFPSSPTLNQLYTFNNRTWKWNGTGWAQVRQAAVTMSATAPTGPSTGDEWFDTSTGIWYRYVDDGNSQQWVETGPTSVATYLPAVPVSGRVTLTSGTSIMQANTAGATTIYFTPYKGSNICIYDGTNWNNYTFSELSNVFANTSVGNAGPAAVANNSNYDLFVWNNAGTMTLSRGPAWTSDTARGSGAGTTAHTLINGIRTNGFAITNGPGANLGTYVGTFRSNGTASCDFNFDMAGTTTGCLATIGIWNMYNRVLVAARTADTTGSHTYNSSTMRARNNNTGNARVQFVTGSAEDYITAYIEQGITPNATGPTRGYCGPGLDSETGGILSNALAYTLQGSSNVNWITARGRAVPQLGFHYISANEKTELANVVTFFDTDGAMYVELMF